MALVASLNPDFRMYWTRENIAHLHYIRMSTIWEGCFKCYMPTEPIFYLSLLILAILMCYFQFAGWLKGFTWRSRLSAFAFS